jgi:hypothetical protein
VRWLLVIALCLSGCGPQKSPRTMHYAQLTLTGGLIGVLASSLAVAATSQHPDVKDAMIGVDIGFGAIAVGSLLVYLVADIYDEEPPSQSAQTKADEEAWEMTKRAREAARKGDCERVKKIEPTVKAKDPSFHDVVFMRDVAIQRCLQAH